MSDPTTPSHRYGLPPWLCHRGHDKNIAGTKKRQCLWCRAHQQSTYWMYVGTNRRHNRQVDTAISDFNQTQSATIGVAIDDTYDSSTSDDFWRERATRAYAARRLPTSKGNHP